MSWEQQAYSFGNPNAQPPTPSQTPTSADFSSPTFQTPRANKNNFDEHTGWTPTFAEEYSVFNVTPGRLTSTGGPFAEIATPRPSTASSHSGPQLIATDLEADIFPQAHHTVQTGLHLPLIDPSLQSASSPRGLSSHGKVSGDKKQLITPRKPRRRLEEAFSGQTATPPQSASKSSRKLAPKPGKDTMQRDHEKFQPSSGTPGLSGTLNFSSGPDDMFSYPMSAPATAPVFSDTKNFWDPDTSMSGMNMDMDFMTGNGTLFDPNIPDRLDNSIDWDRNNHVFQETVGMQSFAHQTTLTPGRQQTMISNTVFDYGITTSAEDPFAMVASSGAVNPGLLFSFPEPISSSLSRPDTASSALTYSQPNQAPAPLIREPYQHQRRESIRDQEEYRRSRSSRESSVKASFSSPAKKGSRPSLSRSASDSRAKLVTSKKPGQFTNILPRISTTDHKSKPDKGRSSPMKHQSRMSLSSIPESVLGTRTAVEFTIDANGRARTETKIIVEEPTTMKRRTPSVNSEEWGSENEDSSTDEDPIMVPSRNTSFSLPPRRSEGPKLANFEISRQSIEGRQHNFSNTGTFSKRGQLEEQESEAETVMDGDDGAGDAANALRKVMESRKQGGTGPGRSQHHMYSSNLNRRSTKLQSTTPSHSQQYYNSGSSTNLSPTTVSDPDLATPSTDQESSRSDSTRCICSNKDGDGFMIQCESCEKWLHAKCVGISRNRLPNVYICAFCAQTPNMRGGRIREPVKGAHQLASSPLAHKSFKSWR